MNPSYAERYTRRENIRWWDTLTDTQKSGLFEKALNKFPWLEHQMGMGGMKLDDEDFVEHFSFGTLMAILGRVEKSHLETEAEREKRGG